MANQSNLERIAVLAARGWISPRQFAGLLGASHGSVLAMIRRGELAAVPVGTHFRIYQEEVERFLREGNLKEASAVSAPQDP